MNNFLLSKVSIWLLLFLITAGCATGPVDYPRIHTESITDTGDTRLGRGVAKWEV